MKNKTEIMKSVNGVASKTVMKLKKHSPEILVVAGIAGTVVSAVLACKATTKVAEILDETMVGPFYANLNNTASNSNSNNGAALSYP